MQCGLVVEVALFAAQFERGAEQFLCASQLARAREVTREAVEGCDAGAGIVQLDRDLEAPFEMVSAFPGKAEDVVRLGCRSRIVRFLSQRECLQGQDTRARHIVLAPGDATAVGLNGRGRGAEPQCLFVVALGELPVSASLVHGADLLLERSAAGRVAGGAGRVVGAQRLPVLRAQHADVADCFVECRPLGVPKRDRSLKVLNGFGRRQQCPCLLGSARVGLRRLGVAAGELQMACHDRGILMAPKLRLRDAAMQQSAPRQSDPLLGDHSQSLVTEVVSGVALDDQAARRQLLKRLRDLSIGATAGDPHGFGVERAADQRRSGEHLRAGLADRVQPPFECRSHATDRDPAAAARTQQLGEEQRQPLGIPEELFSRRVVKPASERELDDVPVTQSCQHNPFGKRGEGRAAVVGVGLVGPPCAKDQQAPTVEAARQVCERVQRRRVAEVQVIHENDSRRLAERLSDQRAHRLEEPQPCSWLVERARRRGPEFRQQTSGILEDRATGRFEPVAARVAQQLREDAVGEAALPRMWLRHEHAHATRREGANRLSREARLADPRFSFDHYEAPALVGRGKRIEQAAKLGRAPDQAELCVRLWRLRGELLHLGPGADRVVQLGRDAERRDAELTVEHANALAVLRERVTPAPRRGVELDQPSVRRLVQLIEREPLAGARDRLLGAALFCEPCDQAVEQSRTLATNEIRRPAAPVVELDGATQFEPGEQLVAVQVAGAGQLRCARVLITRDGAELGEVEPGAVQVERDRHAVADQALVSDPAAQCRERSTQRPACAIAVKLRPQERGDQGPGVGASADRKECEQRGCLARVDGEGGSVDLDAWRSQKGDSQCSHRRKDRSTATPWDSRSCRRNVFGTPSVYKGSVTSFETTVRRVALRRPRARSLPADLSEVAAANPLPQDTAADASPLEIAPNDPIVAYLESAPGAVELTSLDLDSPALHELRASGATLVVPLVSNGELIGLLQLGRRRSDQGYSADDRRLLETLAAQAAPAVRVGQLVREQQIEIAARGRLAQELEVARLIQQNFLPKQLPQLSGWQVAAYYGPARTVGGDFYDFIELPDGRYGLVVGDVTDKGIPAAMVMAATRSVLRASAQRLLEPGAVLARVNDNLCPDIPENMFVTCFYGVLDPTTGHLRYANAGHNLPFVRSGSHASELRATGMPLGLLPGMSYEECETTIAQDTTVLLYSDGLVEAHNAQREMFGNARAADVLAAQHDAEPLIGELLGALAGFGADDHEQEDDITLVVIQRRMRPAAPLADFELTSEPGNEREAMHRVAAALASSGLAPARLERLQTAVAEATMNAMEHGNGYAADRPVRIVVTADEHEAIVQIVDHGGDHEIPAAIAPDIEAKLAGLQSPRGWGLFLIGKMVDRLNQRSDGSLHTVELAMRLKGDEDATGDA